MKYKIFNILIVLVITLISGLLFLSGSCKTKTAVIVPYIPPLYYSCLEAQADELSKNYFTNKGNLKVAEQTYDGLPFVFKGIPVLASMLVDEDTFAYSSIKFVAMQSGAVGKLRVGESIDIVGINRGPLPEVEGSPIEAWFNSDGTPITSIVNGWLLFTDCIFLPARSVELPALGSPVFAPLY